MLPTSVPRLAGQTRAPERASNVAFDVVTVAEGLRESLGLAFLPGGRMLVTEKPGPAAHRRRPTASCRAGRGPARGRCARPGRAARRALDPRLRDEPADLLELRRAARRRHEQHRGRARQAGRGRRGAAVENVQVIYHQAPSLNSTLHFGGRLVFGRDGTLFVTQGERSITEGRMQAQRMDGLLGKIVRINPDGSIPKDNPFVGKDGRAAGDLVVRPSQRPGGDAQSRRPASCGKSSTARAAATRSTSRARARTTAGRRSPTASSIRAGRSPAASPRRTAWSSRSTTGIRSSRRAA